MQTKNEPSNVTRLKPARPHAPDAKTAGYLPRIPWRYVLLGMLSLATVIGGYLFKEQRKAVELRASILRVHETELAPAREAYIAAREKLERLVQSAAEAPTENVIDKRLHLPGLRSGTGLYLRLPLSAASDKADLAAHARAMEPDMIPNCLGLAPGSARGLYEKGEFLLPEFVAGLKEQDSVMHLRVRDDTLLRHIRSDLPSVLGSLRADWFLLVLQEGENRRDAPVRVFLWNLAHEELLLRARVQSQGILLTSHILSTGTNPSTAPEIKQRDTGAANDCSIAAELKRLTKS
jgi:hypothetical protein